MQIDQVYEELLMKMEVLSVQNHIQGQFGVIGSSKVKDWSSPLTPPPPPPPPLPPTQHHQNPIQNQQQQATNSSTNIQADPQTSTPTLPPPIPQPPINNARNFNDFNIKPINNQINQLNLVESQCDIDCVDGRLSTTPKSKYMIQQPTHYHHQQPQQRQHQELQQPQQQQQQQQYQHQPHAHYYYHNHQNFTASAMTAAPAAAMATNADGNTKMPLAATTTSSSAAAVAAAATTLNTRFAAYNNNLLYCGDAAMGIAAIETPAVHLQTPTTTADILIDTNAINELSQRLQDELRTAKSRHLSCTEVSIPWDLTPRIAAEIIRMSEREPCGIRGCTIFIEFEDEPDNIRRIASFKMDPNTVSTFELYLTLKQDKSGWTSLLPQFLKNLTRSSTILISPDFTLTKNKLYSGE